MFADIPVESIVYEHQAEYYKALRNSTDLMKAMQLSHRPTFRKNYLNPALENGWIERTQPDSPHSPTQRYRLTPKGRRHVRIGVRPIQE